VNPKNNKKNNNNNKQSTNNTNNATNNNTLQSASSTSSINSSAQRRSNLNDLVASIINQYTAPASIDSSSPNVNSLTNNLANTLSINNHDSNNDSSSQTLNSNSLLLAPSTLQSIGGVKITVLGIQTTNQTSTTANTVSQTSSTTSSPSSMSITSNMSTASSLINNNNNNRPATLLDLHKPLNKSLFNEQQQQRHFNKLYINPSVTKQSLEKHQKDLQRQTVQLQKIQTQYADEYTKSMQSINQTFSQLQKLLQDKQLEMQTKLNTNAQYGKQLLEQRHAKAADLKLTLDNAQHLNDNDLNELKADIKVSFCCFFMNFERFS
jgi:hypothetical protein